MSEQRRQRHPPGSESGPNAMRFPFDSSFQLNLNLSLHFSAACSVFPLAIFHGPDAYVTPSWYPTKAETGKAVPTWNYAVAHAYGTLRIIDDASWLRAHLEMLTTHNEAPFAEPWHIDDAPSDFTEKLIGAIVGIEIVITRLSGKWKVSQNQPAENQVGVVRGLCASGDIKATEMAALIEGANHAR